MRNVRDLFQLIDRHYFQHTPLGVCSANIDVSLQGTMTAAPPPFRLGDPALCGSRPLVTP